MIFKSHELEPGFYSLNVEYRDWKEFDDNIYIFQGFNKYLLNNEDLKLNFDYREDDELVHKIS